MDMRKIKWIFLDVGGTLVDETEAYDQRLRTMLEKTDLAFDEVDRKRREFFSLGLDGNSQVMKYFKLEKTAWPEEYETLYDEAIPILDHLKASGYRLGIIANQGPGLK